MIGLAAASIVALAITGWGLDWFVIDIHGASFRNVDLAKALSGLSSIQLGLRDVTVCMGDLCEHASISKISRNSYATFASITFWLATATMALIGFQAGARVLRANVSELVTRIGYWAAVVLLLVVVITAFVVGPDVGSGTMGSSVANISLTISRTWAPHLMLLATVIGIGALHAASRELNEATTPPMPAVRVVADRSPPPRDSGSLRRPPSAPIAAIPHWPRFAVATAEITRAGVDAHRHDGSHVLVMWRDVVGVVARRLPSASGSQAFVDLVSTSGSTLRFLPESRLTGDPIATDPELRVRAIIELVIARCPTTHVDRATREFIEGGTIAQIPDAATLAAHDAKLA